MTMSHLATGAALFALAVGASGACHAQGKAQGNVAEGKSKASSQCATCHGADGIAKMPNVPHIAAEDASYLREQLRAFQSGERSDPQMSVVAKQLSDDDIADLAAYYSAVEIKVVRTP
jgi:cytochrome c553